MGAPSNVNLTADCQVGTCFSGCCILMGQQGLLRHLLQYKDMHTHSTVVLLRSERHLL